MSFSFLRHNIPYSNVYNIQEVYQKLMQLRMEAWAPASHKGHRGGISGKVSDHADGISDVEKSIAWRCLAVVGSS